MKTRDYRVYEPVPKSTRGAHVATVVAADAADAFAQCDKLAWRDGYTLRDAETDEVIERPEQG